MLPLTILAVFVFLPGVMFSLARWRNPRFWVYWSMTGAGILVVGLLVTVSSRFSPLTTIVLPILGGMESQLITFFALDALARVMALVWLSLAAALVFGLLQQAYQISWTVWAQVCVISAVGLAIIMSGNLVTLLLMWAVSDALMAFLTIRRADVGEKYRSTMLAVSSRLVALVLGLFVLASAGGDGYVLTRDVGIFVVFAVIFRVGLVPMQVLRGIASAPSTDSQRVLRNQLPVLGAVVLLLRFTEVGALTGGADWLRALVYVGMLVGGIGWLRAADPRRGRPYWVLGVSSLLLIAALNGNFAAAIAWSLALFLPLAAFTYPYAESIFLRPIQVLSVIAVSGLPFTPLWQGAQIFAGVGLEPFVLWISWGILLAGCVRFLRQPSHPSERPAIGEQSIASLGLFSLVATFIFATEWSWREFGTPSPWVWEVGIAYLVGLAALRFVVKPVPLPVAVGEIPRRLNPWGWLLRVFDRFYRLTGNLLRLVTNILEGDGGILWAILLLAVLLAGLTQSGALNP